MNFGIILDLLIMLCGVYTVYWAVQMKSTNKIPPMLVGKNFPINRAKDPAGFIQFTFPFTLAVGMIIVAVGLISTLGFFTTYPIAETMMWMLLIIVLVVYSVFLMRAQKKYLVGM